MYGVSLNIRNVIRRKSYKHVRKEREKKPRRTLHACDVYDYGKKVMLKCI